MLEGELDGDPNTGIDMTRANRKVDQITSNTVDVEVFRAYQVSISKTADRADKHYNVGEQVSFTVKVSNLGVEPLTNLEVADVMPNITLDAASLNNNIKQSVFPIRDCGHDSNITARRDSDSRLPLYCTGKRFG